MNRLEETKSAIAFLRRKAAIAEREAAKAAGSAEPTKKPAKTAKRSIASAAARVLSEYGGTMSGRDIAGALVRLGWYPDSPNLAIMVATACARRTDLFTRPERGKFALKEGA